MARKTDPLAAYNARRDFARTAEPAGTLAQGNGNRFLVQKHDATRLHYDFRLEMDGVLKSWAVTRGPSLDPDQKRLAVRTEDHPLSYASFEGVIPAGEYGGGTVMLWDEGTWAPVKGKSARDIDKGHLHFVLAGQRMRGEWLLVRLKPRANEKRENWLLRKVADAEAGGTDTLTATLLTSVATGRTMEEIAADKPPARPTKKRGRAKAARGKRPPFAEPQLATLVDSVPAGSNWLHEVKYDGYRILIATGGDGPRLYTRTGLDWTDKFPAIADAAASLPPGLLLDGEVVALRDGKPDFSTLQAAIKEGATCAASCSTCSTTATATSAMRRWSSARSGCAACWPMPIRASPIPNMSPDRASNCSRRCVAKAMRASCRNRPTPPIAARGRRRG